MESYFSGNPLCMEDKLIRLQTFMFKRIVGVGMSPRINSAMKPGNSKECHYDGGDCNRF